MGSAQNAAHERLVKALLRWPGLRERPEGDTPFGRSTKRPTLRLNGARFVSFHEDEYRVLHAAFPVPPSAAALVPEAEVAEDGHLEARFSLASKADARRALEVAALLYEVREGRPPPGPRSSA